VDDTFVDWTDAWFSTIIAIYVSVIILMISMVGISLIRVSGSLIETCLKTPFFSGTVGFFLQEENFRWHHAAKIVIDTEKEGVSKPLTAKTESTGPHHRRELSEPMSPWSMKYKTGILRWRPEFYDLPTNNRRLFIAPLLKKLAAM
jgi:hypothetical protein